MNQKSVLKQKTVTRKSLADYVTVYGKRGCAICALPEVGEINAGRAEGYRYSDITHWLNTECGYPKEKIHDDIIRRHFQKGHAENAR